MSDVEKGRYRMRTALRARLPAGLATRVPKGPGDCGDHEWYRSGAEMWRCYHCEQGISHVSPFSEVDEVAGRMAALDCLADSLVRKPLTPEVAGQYRDILGEMLSLLHSGPFEERVFGSARR